MTATGNKSLQLPEHLFRVPAGQQFTVALLIHIPPMANGENGNKNDDQYDGDEQDQHQGRISIDNHGSPFIPAG